MSTAVLVLAGCAGSPGPDAQALSDLQSRVLEVTQAAAGKHFATALTELHALSDAVTHDSDAGAISASKAAGIQATIDLVESDLTAAIAKSKTKPSASPSPEPTPSETPGNGNGNGNSGGGGSGGGSTPKPSTEPAPTTKPSPSTKPSPTPEPSPTAQPSPTPGPTASPTAGAGTGQ